MIGLPREWHGGTLPPGTPAPRAEAMVATCKDCGRTVEAMLHTEMGSSELNPEDCPNCGGELTEVEYNDEEEGFTHD